MNRQTINKIEDELYQVIVEFEKKVKKFFLDDKFLNQKVKSCWKEEFKELHFKFCVINKSKLMLSHTREALYIDSDGKHIINDEINDISDAENWLKHQYADKHIDTGLTEEINHSGNDDFIGKYQTLIMIVYDRKCSKSFHFFVNVVLSFLKKSITDLKVLREMSEKDDWKHFKRKNNFDFMQWYRDEIFRRVKVPNSEVITKLAFLNYENRPNYGTFILVDEKEWLNLSRENLGILKFSEISQVGFDDVGDIEKGPEKMIRKMLETCNQKEENKRFLIVKADNPFALLGIVTSDFFEKNISATEYVGVDYLGFGDWKLRIKDEVLLVYDKGRFKLDEEQSKQNLRDKVKEIEGINALNQESFENMLEILQKQSHGALMVVAHDAKNEANRLCAKYKKGTLIEAIH